MVPIHPGRILRRELRARDLSANALARALRVPSGRIVDILNGKRAISAETASPARSGQRQRHHRELAARRPNRGARTADAAGVIGMKTVTLQVAKLEEVKRQASGAFSVPSSAGGGLRGQSRQDDLGR